MTKTKGGSQAADEEKDENESGEELENAGGKKGAAAAEDTDDENTDDAAAEKERLETEKAEVAAEKERLAEERRQLESQRGSGQPKVTSADLRGMNEAQRAKIEEQTGMEFNAVLSRIEQTERAADDTDRIATKARLNVADAIEAVIEKDPQMAKSKAAIKEYLADFPDSVKADPSKMRELIKKATTYAKGKNPAPAAKRDKGAASTRDERATDDEAPVFDAKKGDIKPGEYRHGDFKLEIKELVSKEKSAKMRNPENPSSVRVSSDFDEAPRFR